MRTPAVKIKSNLFTPDKISKETLLKVFLFRVRMLSLSPNLGKLLQVFVFIEIAISRTITGTIRSDALQEIS